MSYPSYQEMARALERQAQQHLKMLADAKLGNVILPSRRDIENGAVDYVREAECLIAASVELNATAQMFAEQRRAS